MLHNPHNQDISQMTFSFVVTRGPFLIWTLAGVGGWVGGLNNGITTKQFTDDLQPYKDNDSEVGLIY